MYPGTSSAEYPKIVLGLNERSPDVKHHLELARMLFPRMDFVEHQFFSIVSAQAVLAKEKETVAGDMYEIFMQNTNRFV